MSNVHVLRHAVHMSELEDVMHDDLVKFLGRPMAPYDSTGMSWAHCHWRCTARNKGERPARCIRM